MIWLYRINTNLSTVFILVKKQIKNFLKIKVLNKCRANIFASDSKFFYKYNDSKSIIYQKLTLNTFMWYNL